MSDRVRPQRRQSICPWDGSSVPGTAPLSLGWLPCPWDSPSKNNGVDCHFLLQCIKVKSESEVAQSCPTRSDPVDCSPPGSSVHGIFQARELEWGAIAFSVQSTKCWKSRMCFTLKAYLHSDKSPCQCSVAMCG